MRGLSENFMNSLKAGLLKPVLEVVKSDDTLSLEIRKNYINIYYRGGNLLKIDEDKISYKAHFDRKYLDEKITRVPLLPARLTDSGDVEKWMMGVPFLKYEMDLWLHKNPKTEKDFQQIMVRENNFGAHAPNTDYFICDIEYSSSEPSCRFDLIAVRWPSSAASRKGKTELGLAFIELKYSDSALKGSAGLKKHIDDLKAFLGHPDNLGNLKEEMKTVFNQKLELGLINHQNPIKSFSNGRPELIIAIAHHDPESKILENLMHEGLFADSFDLKFATSNYMGYGLYRECMRGLHSQMEVVGKEGHKYRGIVKAYNPSYNIFLEMDGSIFVLKYDGLDVLESVPEYQLFSAVSKHHAIPADIEVFGNTIEEFVRECRSKTLGK